MTKLLTVAELRQKIVDKILLVDQQRKNASTSTDKHYFSGVEYGMRQVLCIIDNVNDDNYRDIRFHLEEALNFFGGKAALTWSRFPDVNFDKGCEQIAKATDLLKKMTNND